MKIIEAYQTLDGEVFTSYTKAKSHADKKFSDKLFPLCHALTGCKYKYVSELILNHLDDFVELKKLKDDLEKDYRAEED